MNLLILMVKNMNLYRLGKPNSLKRKNNVGMKNMMSQRKIDIILLEDFVNS